jgi:hypothetical protein
METELDWPAVASLCGLTYPLARSELLATFRRHPRKLARRLAETLRQHYALGTLPLPIRSILAHEHVELRAASLPFSHGSLLREGNNVVIAINKATAPCRQKFTICHELGHLLLYRLSRVFWPECDKPPSLFHGENVSGIGTEERFCDWFAAYLLIPPDILGEFAEWPSMSVEKLYARAQSLQVCLEPLLWHVIEHAPFRGGAARFQLRRTPAQVGKPCDPARFEVLLTQVIFPRHPKERRQLPRLVSPASDLYRIFSALNSTIAHGNPVSERRYGDVLLDIAPFTGRHTLLVKAIGHAIWILIIPPEGELASAPACQIHLVPDDPAMGMVQGSLFDELTVADVATPHDQRAKSPVC